MGKLTDRGEALRSSINSGQTAMRNRLEARRMRMQANLLGDLAEALPTERQQPALRKEQAKGSIPSTRGSVREDYQPGSGKGTGGIASPLIEGELADIDPENPNSPVLARESYPEQQVVSSDGLFVWEVTPPSKITFRDANGDTAVVQLANPYPEEEEAP